jgi:hypothetical protein
LKKNIQKKRGEKKTKKIEKKKREQKNQKFQILFFLKVFHGSQAKENAFLYKMSCE